MAIECIIWDGKLETVGILSDFIADDFDWWLDGDYIVMDTLHGEKYISIGSYILKGVHLDEKDR